MIKKLTRHGNSWALVIDKPIMDILHISDSAVLEVSTDGKRLIIEPAREGRTKQIEAWFKKEHKRRGEAYKRLSSPE